MDVSYKMKTFIHRYVSLELSRKVDRLLNGRFKLPLKAYPHDVDMYFDVFTSIGNVDDDDGFNRLRSSFLKRRINFDLLDKDWWKLFFVASNQPDRIGSGNQKELIEGVITLRDQDFHPWNLMHFYALCLRLGLLELAHEFRKAAAKKSIDNIVQGKDLSSFSIIRAIAAFIELMEVEKALENYERYSSRLSTPDREMILGLMNLFKVDHDGIDTKFDTQSSSGSIPTLREIIEGQNIAVVGPMETNSEDAEMIDSFDVVCRCNYRDTGVGVDSKVKGMKGEVTLFSSLQLKHLIEQEQFNWPDSLKFVMYRDKKLGSKAIQSINRYYKKINSEPAINQHGEVAPINRVLFNGTLNAIPLMVFQILLEEPDKVMVFHSDLMLTVNRLKNYYPDGSEIDFKRKKNFLMGCSRNHDPLTQFYFLKNLLDGGLIECDSRLKEVLSLTPEDYMAQLQLIYGDAGRLGSS